MALSAIVVIVIVAVTIALLMIRPYQLSEGVIACLGAGAMVLTGNTPFNQLRPLVLETRDVLLFLAGMMILTGYMERAAVFDYLAHWGVRSAREQGRLLYVLIFLLGALITATLSIDVTIIVLTPVIYAFTRRYEVDPIPFMFGCLFVANTGSLIFPMSNLTNLLVYHEQHPGFLHFTAIMWFPNLVAVGVNLLIFLLIFRRSIPDRLPSGPEYPDTSPTETPRLAVHLVILAVTLIALFILGLSGHPLWWAAAGGALVTAVLPAPYRSPAQIGKDVSWTVFLFVLGMSVVVNGIDRALLTDHTIPLPDTLGPAIAVSAAISAVGSNIVNNLPMTILAIRVIEDSGSPVKESLTYGSLVGNNIGPLLTTFGSLATILWFSMLRRYGIVVSVRRYIQVTLITTPLVLLASTLSLWLVMTLRA